MTHAVTAAQRNRIVICVYGTPAPQGSKVHVGNGRMIESSKKVGPWREDVKLAALRALDETPSWDRHHALVQLHVTFTLARPAFHFRTGKAAHLLRPGAPPLPGLKPDLDKLLRSTGDALTTAGVYDDDARIVQVFARKCYPTNTARPPGALDRPGARIILTGVHR